MPQPTDIERLIEDGLSRYAAGDLDGALVCWERALSLDPENAAAASYVDYVHANYDELADGVAKLSGDGDVFGIEEEPEYQIEIVPGELVAGEAAPEFMDPLDQGWFIEEDGSVTVGRKAAPVPLPIPAPAAESEDSDEPLLTLELDAEEPSKPGIEFDDATREFHGASRVPTPDFALPEAPTSEFEHEESTTGFRSEGTPVGFGAQTTDVRARDLGFVRPSTSPGVGVEPAVPAPATDKPSSPLSIGTAPTLDIASKVDRIEAELVAANQRAVESAATRELPSPHREPTRDVTRDLPLTASRTPARDSSGPRTKRDSTTHSQAENLLQHASTRDLGTRSQAPTARQPTGPAPLVRPPTLPAQTERKATPTQEPLISAPTREIGTRPISNPVLDDEDAHTHKVDAKSLRGAPTSGRAPSVNGDPEGTRHDFVLPFDPIEARTAQILEDVDAGAPADEAKDERTRRRITGLFDRALAWNGLGELDKAVTAVDLALSEDPNSALAQKLIHRNRDTMMTVFQNFIGDLERQPQLARPLHELAQAPISPRAAFLLSRIDGTLSIDEILDVSGMPRLEAYRHLCQLFLRGILR